MKRGILCFVFAAFFALPALAAAEVHGVYIAPKFLLGIQDTGQISTDGRFENGDKSFSQHSQAVFGGALAVGYNFAPKFNIPIRTEIEFAMRSNSSSSKDSSVNFVEGGIPGTLTESTKLNMNISTLFFNAYFDINTGTAFTPYIGGGLGMAFKYVQAKAEWNDNVPGLGVNVGGSASKSKHDTTFAWNVGAGLAYAFTENVSADLGYRFVHTGNSELKTGGAKVYSSSPYIHEFYLGARFTF